MTPSTQVKLLRVLQEQKFRRLGGRHEQTVNVRVIAATNANPAEAVKSGKLREDLYYRLNVFAIELPPLRRRKADLPLLIQSFLAECNARNNKAVAGIDPSAMRILEQYNWPGNVRELRNVIERAVILGSGDFIEAKCLPPFVNDASDVLQPTVSLEPGTTVEEAETTVDPDDARAHARQQDARGGDPRDQSQDPPQQTQQAARTRRGETVGRKARVTIVTPHAFMGLGAREIPRSAGFLRASVAPRPVREELAGRPCG